MSDTFEFEDKAKVERLIGTLHDPAATVGDVLTVQADKSIAAQPGGGSMPELFYFEFAHDLAGLTEGVEFYTPTIGDIVLNAWISVLEAWDGVNPAIGDYGTFTDEACYGFFAGDGSASGDAWYMTAADIERFAEDGEYGMGALVGGGGLSSDGSIRPSGIAYSPINGGWTFRRLFPYQFTTADPLKMCVSQDGQTGGDDPASATGLARLYMQIVTPQAFTP